MSFYIYVFSNLDAMADGGVKMGLTRDMALKLSIQTMKGASEMMQKQYGLKHHMQMKDEVNIKQFILKNLF